MLTWETIVPILQAIGQSVLAGLAYSVSGYLNYWVEQRKQNADAPWDWRKLLATLNVALVVGIIIGLAQYFTGNEVGAVYELISSIGLITLLKKWVSILWYGQEQSLGKLIKR